MTLVTVPIDQLTEITSVEADDFIIVKQVSTGKDRKVRKSNLMAGTTVSNIWEPEVSYDTNEIKEWEGKWWKSLEDDNAGNVPREDTHWTQIDPADESSIKVFQSDKVYKSDIVVVLYDGILRRLKEGITLPYSASTFVDNDWDNLYTDRTAQIIHQVAHGFSRYDILTVDETGAIVQVTSANTQVLIGMVRRSLGPDTFEMVMSGYVDGLQGMTPGLTYYGRDAGDIVASPSLMPVLIAVTATTAYMIKGAVVRDHNRGVWNPTGSVLPSTDLMQYDIYDIELATPTSLPVEFGEVLLNHGDTIRYIGGTGDDPSDIANWKKIN